MKVFMQNEFGKWAFYEEGTKDYTLPLCVAEDYDTALKLREAINESSTKIAWLETEVCGLNEMVVLLSARNVWWPCEDYEGTWKRDYGCDNNCAPCRVKWAREWSRGWRPE